MQKPRILKFGGNIVAVYDPGTNILYRHDVRVSADEIFRALRIPDNCFVFNLYLDSFESRQLGMIEKP